SYADNEQYKNFIPTNLGMGGAYTYQFDQYNKITFALDLNKLLVPTPDTLDTNGNGVPDFKEKSVISGIFGSFSDAPGGFKEEMNEINYAMGGEYGDDDVCSLG